MCIVFFLFHTVDTDGPQRRELAEVAKELIDLLKEENKSALDKPDKEKLINLLTTVSNNNY